MSEGNNNGQWMEMFMTMGKNHNGFVAPSKVLEPLVELTKVQQQQYLKMSKAWVDHLWKIGEASRSGDIQKVWETYRDSNKDLLNACQESLKEQATARYQLLRTVIPAIGEYAARD